jgi:hypothetical protein
LLSSQHYEVKISTCGHSDEAITIGNRGSFIGDYIFIGTNEYIKIIFAGHETNEHKVVFISFVQAPTNIWVVRFGFD